MDLDPSKIVVSGNSAGGCLALLAAGSRDWPLAAAIAFYAPIDFLGEDARSMGAPEAMSFLLGDDVSEARLKAVSPLTYVGPDFPPTLLLTGNRDDLVDSGQSIRMYDALRAAGVAAEIHIFDGAPHAFDAIPEFGRHCSAVLSLFLETHVLNPRKIELPSS
jgi:acetyl esterase/lipase